MKLSRSMSLDEFRRGYWYATDLKEFADTLGIPSAAKLRKDELERAIESILTTGRAKAPARSLDRSGERDVDRGLSLKMRVVNYTSNRETKDFLVREAEKMSPGLKRKSGARYRLNRWREQQLTSGVPITYRDLVAKYVELNSGDEKFARIPTGRYINFLADYLAKERGATREGAIAAWKKLKKLNVPKDYASWVAATKAKKKK